MPLEFAHVLAAVKVSTDPAFIMGAVWPDIRYLARIDRTITHQADLPLGTSKLFAQGVYLHRKLDQQWSDWAPTDSQISISVYKLLFDDYLIRRTPERISISDTVLADEKLWGIDLSHLTQWHIFIQNYLDSKSLDELLSVIKATIPLPDYIWIDIEDQIQSCLQDPHHDDLMEKIHSSFESWISSYCL